jgi:hypothetical protein
MLHLIKLEKLNKRGKNMGGRKLTLADKIKANENAVAVINNRRRTNLIMVEERCPGWEEKLYELAKKGDGIVSWFRLLKIHDDSFNTLLRDEPIFYAAIRNAYEMQEEYWERQAIRMVEGGKGDGRVWGLVMANKFGWKTGATTANVQSTIDAKISDPSKVVLSDEELLKQLRERGLPTRLLIENDDSDSKTD